MPNTIEYDFKGLSRCKVCDAICDHLYLVDKFLVMRMCLDCGVLIVKKVNRDIE